MGCSIIASRRNCRVSSRQSPASRLGPSPPSWGAERGSVLACRRCMGHSRPPWCRNRRRLWGLQKGPAVRRRVEDAGHLPRRLSEVSRTLADTTASLNPDLACNGCPTSDTRVPVNNTKVAPWNALGLLALQDAYSISRCLPSHPPQCRLAPLPRSPVRCLCLAFVAVTTYA